jgi:hypothetical protein
MFDLHYTTVTSKMNYKQTFESKEDIFREIAIFSTSKDIASWEAYDKHGRIGNLDKGLEQIDENDLVPDYITMSIDKNGLPIIVIKEEEETDWEFDENGDYNF